MAQRIPYFLAALADYGKPVEATGPAPGPFPLLFTRRWPDKQKTEYVDALIQEAEDGAFRIVIEGGTNYKERPIHVAVTAPSGKVTVEKALVYKPGGFRIALEVPQDGEAGVYKLQIHGRGSFWRVMSTLRTDPRKKIVYPLKDKYFRFMASRYYFLAPAGSQAVVLRVRPLGSAAVVAVRHPDGEYALRRTVSRNDEGTIRIPVPPRFAGKLWTLEGWSSTCALSIEAEGAEMPQVVSTDPELFFLPEAK
jgi:hypothetical protein